MKKINLREKLAHFAAAVRTIICDLGDRIRHTFVLREGIAALLLLVFSYMFLSVFADYSDMKGTVLDPELNYRKLDKSLYSHEYLEIKVTRIQGVEYVELEMINSSPVYEAKFSVGAFAINGCRLNVGFEKKLAPGESVRERIDISKALDYGIINVEKLECYVCFKPTYSVDLDKLEMEPQDKKAELEKRSHEEKKACSLILFSNYQPVPMLDMTQVYSDSFFTVWLVNEPEPDDEEEIIPEYEGMTIIYRNNCSYTAKISMSELRINTIRVKGVLKQDDMLCTPGDYGMIHLPIDGTDWLDLEQLQNAERVSVKFCSMNYGLDKGMYTQRHEMEEPLYLRGEAPVKTSTADADTGAIEK